MLYLDNRDFDKLVAELDKHETIRLAAIIPSSRIHNSYENLQWLNFGLILF